MGPRDERPRKHDREDAAFGDDGQRRGGRGPTNEDNLICFRQAKPRAAEKRRLAMQDQEKVRRDGARFRIARGLASAGSGGGSGFFVTQHPPQRTGWSGRGTAYPGGRQERDGRPSAARTSRRRNVINAKSAYGVPMQVGMEKTA